MPESSSASRFQSMISGLHSQGLSYGQIATLSHLSRATVWRGGIGDTRQPSADTFRSIERIWKERGAPVVK